MREELKEALLLLTNEQLTYMIVNQLGLSYEEIAEIKGVSKQSVHKMVEKGRAKINKRLLHMEAVAMIQELFCGDGERMSKEDIFSKL